MSDYMNKDGQRWGDDFLREYADRICHEYDNLVEVLEWLEKKFE